MSALVNVPIAELAVATAGTTLVTTGLGSCVAIALLDARQKVGALAHVLLPHSALS
jgi:chemotaxis protein CheD